MELVRTSERQRGEVVEAVADVKAKFAWVRKVAAVAKAGGPVFMGAAGLAGALFGARSKGLLGWISRVRTGMRVVRIVRQFLQEKR